MSQMTSNRRIFYPDLKVRKRSFATLEDDNGETTREGAFAFRANRTVSMSSTKKHPYSDCLSE